MKYLSTLLLLTILFSCNNQPVKQNQTDSLAGATQVATTNGPLDTLILGHKKCIVYALAESPFGPLPYQDEEVMGDSTDAKAISAVADEVSRVGDSLLVRTAGADTAVLFLDNLKTDGDDYVGYRFEEFIPEINCFLISVSLYEGAGYMLLNKATGTEIYTWSKPVISPDRKWMMCPSFDMEAGFQPNGFQLLRYNNGEIMLVGEHTTKDWGPGRIKWLDNTTLIGEQIKMDYNKSGDMREITTAIKMVLE